MFVIFFNSFSMAMSLVLLDTIFLLRLDSLLLKSVFVTKSACASFSLLNSVVVVYLSWVWLVISFSISVIFVS